MQWYTAASAQALNTRASAHITYESVVNDSLTLYLLHTVSENVGDSGLWQKDGTCTYNGTHGEKASS